MRVYSINQGRQSNHESDQLAGARSIGTEQRLDALEPNQFHGLSANRKLSRNGLQEIDLIDSDLPNAGLLARWCIAPSRRLDRTKPSGRRAADAIAYTQTTCQPGYAYTTIISSKYHGQPLLSHLASLYPQLNPTSLATKTEQRRSHPQPRHRPPKANRSFGSNPCLEPSTLDRTRLPSDFEVLFEDPRLLAVNKPSGLPTLPGAASWKTPFCAVCKSKPPTQTLSTGWAEPHRHRPFAKTPQAASNLFANWNTPKIQKIYRALGSKHCTARRLRNPHTHRPRTRTRSSVPCGLPTQVANRQSSLAKVILTHCKHHNI